MNTLLPHARTLCMVLAFTLQSGLVGQDPQTINTSTPTSTTPNPTDGEDVDESTIGWNLKLPTLGGKQFWTDHRWWYGWRVQYNSTMNHWRILDPNDVRHAWGGGQAMMDEFAKIVANIDATQHPTPPDEVIVLLHGLMRTTSSMRDITKEVERANQMSATLAADGKPPNRVAFGFSYSSTRTSLDAHAAAFREVIENLPGSPRISVVGHSMGNIVFRHAIADWQRKGDPKGVLPRLQRAVMLGPPNQGSAFAKSLSRLGLFETITGRSGLQLGQVWDEIQKELGTPPCPFVIVAGDISSLPIQNPLLDGRPSDGVVTIDEASLDGAEDLVTVPLLHSFLMNDPKVVRATVDYLSGSSFRDSLNAQ